MLNFFSSKFVSRKQRKSWTSARVCINQCLISTTKRSVQKFELPFILGKNGKKKWNRFLGFLQNYCVSNSPFHLQSLVFEHWNNLFYFSLSVLVIGIKERLSFQKSFYIPHFSIFFQFNWWSNKNNILLFSLFKIVFMCK